MVDFKSGDEFIVQNQDLIPLEVPVEKVKIDRIEGNDVIIKYVGSDPLLPQMETISAADVSIAIDKWQDKS